MPEFEKARKKLKRLRVLFCEGRTLYGARKTRIVRSLDDGETWKPVAKLKLPAVYAFASHFRPSARLGRTEVYKLHVKGDRAVALCKGGVYSGNLSDGELPLTHRVTQGSRPISLALGPDGAAYFGDYYNNPERGPVRIYKSTDLKTWQVIHEFSAGDIRHVHGIFYDHFENLFWVLTGDFGEEPGILKCSHDFSEMTWLRRGTQSVRAYTVLVRPEGLLYATDTEIERNALYFIDREGRELRKLHDVESSSFHAAQFGAWSVFATVCEPSALNDCKNLHIWGTKDLKDWVKIAQFSKDAWPFIFQFGNVFFPEGDTVPLNEIILSGTGLRGIDDATVFIPLPERGRLT